MPRFYGISPGEEKTAPGIRVRVSEDGENVWMHGKWLGLGLSHAVIWIGPKQRAKFRRRDGSIRLFGQFPAWVITGNGKSPAVAAMFDWVTFEGGEISIA